MDWFTLNIARNRIEAELVKGFLKSKGIDTKIIPENSAENTLYIADSIAPTDNLPWKVLVKPENAMKAAEFLLKRKSFKRITVERGPAYSIGVATRLWSLLIFSLMVIAILLFLSAQIF